MSLTFLLLTCANKGLVPNFKPVFRHSSFSHKMAELFCSKFDLYTESEKLWAQKNGLKHHLCLSHKILTLLAQLSSLFKFVIITQLSIKSAKVTAETFLHE